jgi:hypothetical protein
VLWTVAQAVTWIAFGDAQPISNWGKFAKMSRDWPVQPANSLVAPLEALARGATIADDLDPHYWALAEALSLAEKPDVLLQDLRADLEIERGAGEKIGAAGQLLWRSVREEHLKVYAVPTETPFARREVIDADLLARFPLALHLDGQIAPAPPRSRYQGPTFVDAGFEPDSVQKLWPPAPPQGAREWMLAEAQASFDRDNRPGKQDDLVKRCVDATRCTHREALAAHKGLPGHLRRSRGKPTKDSN